MTVAAGATFDLAGFSATTASLAGAGNIAMGSGFLTTGTGTSSFSGTLDGTGGLIKIGNGTLTLSGVNTYTGATTINAGTLALNGSNSLNSGTDVTIANGGTLALNGGSAAIASLSGFGNLSLGNATIITGANSSTFGGTISDSGGLAKSGSGILTLSGSSSYSGTTTISGGAIIARNANALGAANGGITLATGAELQLENDITLVAKALALGGTMRNNSGTNAYTGAIALSSAAIITSDAGTLEVRGNTDLAGNSLSISGAGSTIFSGALNGTGNVIKSGSGLLLFNGANTYTGTTNIAAGTMQIDAASAFGATGAANATTVAPGATLLIDEPGNGLSVAAETLYLSGMGAGGNGALHSNAGANVWNGNIVLAASSTIQVDAETLALAGQLTETGGSRILSKTGAGTLLLAGAASHSGGTNLVGGILQLDGSDRLPAAGALAISSGATFDLNDYDQTVGQFSGSGIADTGATATGSGGGTLTVGNSNSDATFSGNLQGAGDLLKIGTGQQTLAGSNGFTGSATVENGKLEVAANNALGGIAELVVNTGGTLLLSGASATDRIDNSADIQLGGGTFARNAGNEGTAASRSAGGTLTGSSSVGLGALTLSVSSTLDFGVGVVGTLNFSSFLANGFVLNILNYTPGATAAHVDGQSDRLVFNQSQSSNLASFNFGSNYSAATQISLGNGFYEITATAVPEPSTWLGAFAVTGLIGTDLYRRRKARLRRLVAS